MGDVHEKIATASAVRRAYETEGIYSVQTICRKTHDGVTDYVDELLADKLETVRRHLRPGLVVDLCCGTGDHLFDVCPKTQAGLGLDFSQPFIMKAVANAREQSQSHITFAVADGARLPLPTASVGTLYCLSALYQIPRVEFVFAEVGRVLAQKGRAILDLGNRRSINFICSRAYPEIPEMTAIPVRQMLELSRDYGLAVIEHRAFQILPLWAGRPRWLWPLLHPGWKRIMKKRIRGRMIDEWISGSRSLKKYAFRHLLVVERTT